MTVYVITTIGYSSWTVPNFVTSINVECIAAGTPGGNALSTVGGAGGGYACTSSLSVSAGQTIYSYVSSSAANSWVNISANNPPSSTSQGALAIGTSQAVACGQVACTSGGIGTVVNYGGSGGNGYYGGGGGGGAAGPSGWGQSGGAANGSVSHATGGGGGGTDGGLSTAGTSGSNTVGGVGGVGPYGTPGGTGGVSGSANGGSGAYGSGGGGAHGNGTGGSGSMDSYISGSGGGGGSSNSGSNGGVGGYYGGGGGGGSYTKAVGGSPGQGIVVITYAAPIPYLSVSVSNNSVYDGHTTSITAILANSYGSLTASLSGAGSLSTTTPTSGVAFTYYPPESGTGNATITVTDSTDSISNAVIINYYTAPSISITSSNSSIYDSLSSTITAILYNNPGWVTLVASLSGAGSLSTTTPTSGTGFNFTAPATGNGSSTITVTTSDSSASNSVSVSYKPSASFIMPFSMKGIC